MAEIFISYKREDKARVKTLVEVLEASGLWVWWDQHLAGEAFGREIADQLDKAKCAILIWSARAASSAYVAGEAAYAESKGKLICVRIDDVPLPPAYAAYDRIDLIGCKYSAEDEAFEKLLLAVSRKLGRPRPRKNPQRHALLFGIRDYEDATTFPEFGDCRGAVDALARALAKQEPEGFKCVPVFDAHRKTVWLQMEEFAKQLASNDVALIYFTGHARFEDGLCLCLKDTNASMPKDLGIPLEALVPSINKLAADRIILLFDWRLTAGGGDASDAALVKSTLTSELSRGKGKYVLAAYPKPGQPGDGSVAHALTRSLIEGLGTFDADRSRDGIITLDEWFDYAQEKVTASGALCEKLNLGFSSKAVEIARRSAPSAQPVRQKIAIDPMSLDKIGAGLRGKRINLFLGDGIYGRGPLCSDKIVSELARDRATLRTDQSLTLLPTAGEYLLRHVHEDNRGAFLGEFRELLDREAKQCERRLAHELVLKMEAPWLVISTSYDWELERRLEAAGSKFVVVSHVLRSADKEYNGKIIAYWPGEPAKWELTSPDDWDVEACKERIVYKVLGSPFLDQRVLDPPKLEIDSVVVTETDYTHLLALLEDRETGVPAAFADPFRLRVTVFLGYRLDLWHYRLLGHLFSKYGPVPLEKNLYAVGQPTTLVEKSSWKMFNAEMIECEPEAFAQELLAQLGGT